jgi:hypothetical protein
MLGAGSLVPVSAISKAIAVELANEFFPVSTKLCRCILASYLATPHKKIMFIGQARGISFYK